MLALSGVSASYGSVPAIGDISIVVGLALPPPSPLMYAEYSFLGKTDPDSSYLMISLLPALRKAFQSAGSELRAAATSARILSVRLLLAALALLSSPNDSGIRWRSERVKSAGEIEPRPGR